MLFSLKFHRDNRQNALALYSAKRKTGEKGCIFHLTVEMKQPQYNRTVVFIESLLTAFLAQMAIGRMPFHRETGGALSRQTALLQRALFLSQQPSNIRNFFLIFRWRVLWELYFKGCVIENG